ncbi:homoprotocatechuate degradation operon regulator HpaR [Bradyrhizobium yuanmingense]|uniref:homoprotocatechuate degradation operon regulator HpaR n=1 Tax=Bradyrhizobium yuanmingense TaxID=108015 RepID=UPI0023B92B02|nr:homoprotocatechuate degradation operon regulator HpaR [Bradyrhizobium yuanmingense]MDF0520206.1 homoprotocatechuate degradation operon regulator HpaR [Bradyrhizobium yuanmingense]
MFETGLPVALLRAREAVMFHMRPILRAHGFTEQQWRVMRKLHPSVPIDKTTLSSRATLLMPSLLRILRDLEEMELIRLVSSARNPRLSRVILSAKGAAAVARTSADIERAMKAVRTRIGEASVAQLLELLQTVESRLTGFSLP